jgi:hypothetical protein
VVPIALASDFAFYVYSTVTTDPTQETRDKDLAAKGRRMFSQYLRRQKAEGGSDAVKENFVFFEGSEIFAVRRIPFPMLPHIITGTDGDQTELRIIAVEKFVAPSEIVSEHDVGDVINDLPNKVPRQEQLIKYASLILSRRMAEEYKKWDQHFLNLQSKQEHGSLTVYQGA